MSRTTPLNGLLTHPLKPATIAVLRAMSRAREPTFSYEINAGSADRLCRESLIEQVTHNRKMAYRITDAGRARIAEIDAKKGGS